MLRVNMVKMTDRWGLSVVQTVAGVMLTFYGVIAYYVLPSSIMFHNLWLYGLGSCTLFFALTIGLIFICVYFVEYLAYALINLNC